MGENPETKSTLPDGPIDAIAGALRDLYEATGAVLRPQRRQVDREALRAARARIGGGSK